MKGKPVLKCFAKLGNSNLLAMAWCPFCETWHQHGFDKDLAQGRRSHRVSHCTEKGSPLYGGGYYLQPVSLEEMKQFVTGYVEAFCRPYNTDDGDASLCCENCGGFEIVMDTTPTSIEDDLPWICIECGSTSVTPRVA